MAGPGGVEAARLNVRVAPNTARFAQTLRIYLTGLENRLVLRIRLQVREQRFLADVHRLIRIARDTAQLDLPAQLDTTDLVNQARHAAALVERRARVRLPVDLDLRGLGSRLAALAAMLAKVGGFAVLATAAAAATAQIVALAAAMAPAAGAVGLLPAVALAGTAAMVTLKLAMAGVGDTIKAGLSGDTAAYAEGLAKLSPAARDTARSIVALKPALDTVRSAVQDRVFAGIGADIAILGRHYLPLLRTRLGDIGGALNVALRGFANMAMSTRFVTALDLALGNAGSATRNLAAAAKPLTGAFGDLAAVGSSFLPQLTAGAGAAASRFAAMISAARDSGRLHQVFARALEVLRQLGQVLANVGASIAAVFRAGQAAGGGLLATLVTATAALRAFLTSAQGQTALTSLFTAAATILAALLPIVQAVAVVFGTVLAPALAKIAQVALPALLPLIDGLGKGLAAATPGVVALFSAFASGLASLGPTLQVAGAAIGQALAAFANSGALQALATGLSKAVAAIAPALPGLAAAFGTLLAAAAPLLPVAGTIAALFVGVLAEGLKLLAALARPVAAALGSAGVQGALQQAGQAIAAFAAGATPLFARFGAIFGQALQMILPKLLQLVPVLLTGLLPAFVQVANAGLQLLVALLPLIPPLVNLLVALTPIIVLAAQLAAKIITALIPALLPLIELVVKLAALLVGVLAKAIGLITSAVLGPLVGALKIGIGWFGAALTAVVGFVTGAAAWIGSLPGKIVGWFSSAGQWLVGAGRAIVNGLWSGIQSGWSWITDQVANLAKALLAAAKKALGIGSPSRLFANVGVDVVRGFVTGIDRARPLAVGAMRTLAKPPAVRTYGPAELRHVETVRERSEPEVHLLAKVQIGDRPVRDMVRTEIDVIDAATAAALGAGLK